MLKKLWMKIMRTKKIEIEIPEGKKAEWINGVLTLVDESQKDNRPVTERIKTFEDACEELGAEHPLVKLWTDYPYIGLNSQSEDVVAYMKLRIICAALNEGWEPQFTEDEWRYFPWFTLYTQQEIENMDEDECAYVTKTNCNIYPKPTLYMTQKWLRSRGYHVEVSYMSNDTWIYEILTIPRHDLVGLADKTPTCYTSYEYALQAGILEALKLI